MFKKIQKKLRSDRGDSSIVSMLFVIPLLLGILFTIFDISAYFASRAYIQTVANTGARAVAIMGGDGTQSKATALEKKYGTNRDANCNAVKSDLPAAEAKKSTSSGIECALMVDLQSANGLVNTTIQSVVCTPNSTTAIGERTSCKIGWTYGGTPGSTMSLLPIGSDGKYFGQDNNTAGSSSSEVNLNGALVAR